MSVRTDIEKRIEKERQRVTELQNQVEKSESFIQGMQEALKMLPKESEKDTRRMSKTKTTTTFRTGSDVEKAYSLLRETGKPMHISEILVGIGKEDTKANRMSLSSSLSRYVRNDELFKRPAPNSFALKETKESVATMALNLPAAFGTEEK